MKKRWILSSIGTVLVFFLFFYIFIFISDSRKEVPTDWHLIDVKSFNLMVPPDWKYKPLQGIDSFVGKISNNDTELMFDFGYWSGSFEGIKESDYSIKHKFIGRHWAEIVVSKIPDKGFTGIYFGHLSKGLRLNLYGENLSSSQQDIALQIFQTIRFK